MHLISVAVMPLGFVRYVLSCVSLVAVHLFSPNYHFVST